MVYTDGHRMCADTEAELHAFARSMGMFTGWYRNTGEDAAAPFYHIFGNARKLILRQPADVKQYITAQEFNLKAREMLLRAMA